MAVRARGESVCVPKCGWKWELKEIESSVLYCFVGVVTAYSDQFCLLINKLE